MPFLRRPRRRVHTWLLLAGLAVLVALVSLAVMRHLERRSLQADAAQAREQLRLKADAMQALIERYGVLPAVLALDPDIRAALLRPDAPAGVFDSLNHKLEAVNGAATTSTLTLLDRNGLAVAASNWRIPGSSNVGNNYRFRPYFQRAMQEGSGTFYAEGVTTAVPGYFLSEAVRDAQGVPVGMVVVKVVLRPLEASWGEMPETVFANDGNGVIFLSSRPTWRYRVLHQLDAALRPFELQVLQQQLERVRAQGVVEQHPQLAQRHGLLGADQRRLEDPFGIHRVHGSAIPGKMPRLPKGGTSATGSNQRRAVQRCARARRDSVFGLGPVRPSGRIVAQAPQGEGLAHVLGHRRMEFQRLPGHGVNESQPVGMQRLALQVRKGCAAVQGVAHQRVPQRCHVHPDLVRAPGVQGALHPAALVRAIQALEVGARRLARVQGQIDDRHAQAVARIAPDRGLHRAALRPRPGAMRQGQVLALDLARSD